MKPYFRKFLSFEMFLLLSVWAMMLIPGAGEWYAINVYPVFSDFLSLISSVFPFSLSDVFIYGSIIFLLAYLAVNVRRSALDTFGFIVSYLLFAYAWFYLAWGMNYYRDDFYTRSEISPAEYDETTFKDFLRTYIDTLNSSYIPINQIDTNMVSEEVRAQFAAIAPEFGLKQPKKFHSVKPMISTPMMSSVGVMGYIGPFFNEATVSGDLRPVQYPFTYAHEMSHLLGTAGEGEANFYAWKVCVSSQSEVLRFSGWFSILRYVVSNAWLCLPEEEFDSFKSSIRPEIVELYNSNNAYWREKYNPFLGEIQNYIYDIYLKGNNVGGGTENYSEVVRMIVSGLNTNNFRK